MFDKRRRYSVLDLIVRLARQGDAVDTIARTFEITPQDVDQVCSEALEKGELLLPPARLQNSRAAASAELTRLQAELDVVKERYEQIKGAINPRPERFFGYAGLTKSEARVLALIVTRLKASQDSLLQAVSGEGDSVALVRVYVCKIRKKLTPLGIKIKNVWGYGYEISAADKERLIRLAELPECLDAPPLVAEPELV